MIWHGRASQAAHNGPVAGFEFCPGSPASSYAN